MSAIEILLICLAIIMLVQWLIVIKDAKEFETASLAFVDLPRSSASPLITVVIPARNEGDNLKACLDSLEKQTYKNIEVLLVNDRSSDNTGKLMSDYAQKNSGWRYLEITELPLNWLGKNHAMYMAALQAKGDYIVFSDGDILFAPPTLQIAADAALFHNLDLLVLTPRFITRGFFLAAMQSFFAIILLSKLKLGRVGKSPKYYVGAGAFNMVKRSHYLSFDGHKKLRLELIDDIMLGKAVVQAQGRIGCMEGQHLISVSWYHSAWGMVKGLEKNGFSAFRFSIWRLLGVTATTLWFHVFPYVILFFAVGWPFYLFLSTLILSHILFAVAAWRMGFNPLVSLLIPFAALTVYFAHLRSAVLALVRGNISWRETKYSLKLLKENMLL